MNNLITLNNISKEYNTLEGRIEAIKDISLTICEGDIIAILGPSGCGKSTLLSIIASLDNSSSGTVEISNDITLSYMLQSDALFNWMTIYQNAVLGLIIQKKYTKEYLDYVDYLFDFYNLTDFKDNYPKSLSGGMKQRVACSYQSHQINKFVGF